MIFERWSPSHYNCPFVDCLKQHVDVSSTTYSKAPSLQVHFLLIIVACVWCSRPHCSHGIAQPASTQRTSVDRQPADRAVDESEQTTVTHTGAGDTLTHLLTRTRPPAGQKYARTTGEWVDRFGIWTAHNRSRFCFWFGQK